MYMYRLYMYLLDLLNGWDENCIISGALETVVVTIILVFTDSVVTLGFRVNLQYTLFIFSDDSDDSYSSIVVNRGHQWLQCVSQRSGLPFWLLSSTLFLSIFFLIWLCCATATTTPREKGKVQSAVLCAVLSFKKKKLIIHHSIKLWTRNWSDTITVKHEALLLSIFLLSREWPRQNFSLLYLCNIMQASNENKKISIMGLLIELKPKLSKLTWWESFARQ